MATDIEIARQAKMKPIGEIAARLGIPDEALEPYGRTKAKIAMDWIKPAGRTAPDGKLILVTAINPTPAGEGKTTTSVGLTDGAQPDRQERGRVPARAVARPVVRDEGRRRRRRLCPGRADGGHQPPLHRRLPRDHQRAQPAQRDDRQPHLLGQRAGPRHPPDRLAPRARHERPRAAPDRHTRSAASPTATRARPGFDITVASEIMAILCLATSIEDLEESIGNIIVGYRRDKTAVTARDIKAARRDDRAAQVRRSSPTWCRRSRTTRRSSTAARSPTSPTAATR